MTAAGQPESSRTPPALAGFRLRLFVALMLIGTAAAGAGLFYAQHTVADGVRREIRDGFERDLEGRQAVRRLRDAVLAERCRALARRPRIHAALEDGAVDLLYPSARDELADMIEAASPAADGGAYALRARFYRFLDERGAVIPPPDPAEAGDLAPAEEAILALPALPGRPQTGYVLRRPSGRTPGSSAPDEVIAMPIVSTETGAVISAIVVGFRPVDLGGGLLRGIWTAGRLCAPGATEAQGRALAGALAPLVASPGFSEGSRDITLDGGPALLCATCLNPGSGYPPAYEVDVFPLSGVRDRQRALLWEFAGAGAILVLVAALASTRLAARLSRPVEKLAEDSWTDRDSRARAEAALEITTRELQRSARFSADASHQLKTPVTVLRAGLEELLAGEALAPEAREEVSALVHQTFRLTGMIEDLLLLSRIDAGRLRIDSRPVDLPHLVDAWIDDFEALRQDTDPTLERDLEPGLAVAGERRFTRMIVENLLDNARKYNRPGGRIRICGRAEDAGVILSVGNSGATIPPSSRERIFERFHRAGSGENIPGHGLGLNVARDLARLHGGELRLVVSGDDWTEFELRLPAAGPLPDQAGPG